MTDVRAHIKAIKKIEIGRVDKEVGLSTRIIFEIVFIAPIHQS